MSMNTPIDNLAEDIANGEYDDHLESLVDLVRNRKAALQLLRLKNVTKDTIIVMSSTMDPYYMRDKKCRVERITPRRDGSKKYTVIALEPIYNTARRRIREIGLYAEHIGEILPAEESSHLKAV